MKHVALLATIALSFPLIACKGGGTTGNAAREAMSAYAEGYNEIINNIPSFIKSYSSSIDTTKGAKGYERAWTVCSGIWMKIDTVKKAFSNAKSSAPDEMKDVGPMADKLLASATAISKQRDVLCKYLKAEDFKDDDGAKGKEIDTALQAAYKEYREALGKMDDALSTVEDQQILADLKKYESDKSYSYWWRKMNYQSKVTLGKLKKDATALDATIKDWETHQAEFGKWTEGKADKLHASMKSYADQVDRYHANLKKMRRAVNEAKDDAKKAKKFDQGYSQVVSAYNTMISVSNGLSSLEGNSLLKDK